MAKNVEITEQIQRLITATQGEDVEFDKITVFEATIASTRPLNKQDTIFENAVMSEDLLRLMAAGLNAGDFAVPLHTLHQQGWELPVGRVFNAEVLQVPDGGTELRAMFYLGEDQAEVISRINNSIIDEVSVGVKAKQALCSECGFDFFGADADFDNLWSRTCSNEHTVGEDGMFLRLIGLDQWLELSLVSRGAASKPKILGRTKQRLGEEAHRRIAASGSIPEATVLYAQSKGFNMPGENTPGENTTVDLSPITEALATATTAIAALGESMTTMQADVTELKAAAPAAEAAAEIQTKLDEATAKVTALEASEAELKTTVTSLEAAATLKAGGVSASAVGDATPPNLNPTGRLAAFKTPK